MGNNEALPRMQRHRIKVVQPHQFIQRISDIATLRSDARRIPPQGVAGLHRIHDDSGGIRRGLRTSGRDESKKTQLEEKDSVIQEKNNQIEERTSQLLEKQEEIHNYTAQIKTYDVVLHVKPEKASQIHAQVINGEKCLVIPMRENENATINGVNTNL